MRRASRPAAGAARGGERPGTAVAPRVRSCPAAAVAATTCSRFRRGGMVHVMNPQVGTDQIPPVKFLPPNAKVVGSILVDNVLYAATTGKCGGAPTASGQWISSATAKTVATLDTKGAAVAGCRRADVRHRRHRLRRDRQRRLARRQRRRLARTRTLKQRDWFSAADAVHLRPVVFQSKGKDLIVAANKDGRLYLLDSGIDRGSRSQHRALQDGPDSRRPRRMSPASPRGSTPPGRAG